MVSEPLLWHFLSSIVFIGVTPFSTSLPLSQQPPQPLAVEPLKSSSCCPWVSNLQPPSLRSFILQRPLPFASPPQILLRLHFWRYHWDRLTSIYTLVEASKPSETSCAPTHHSKVLFRSARPSTCHYSSGLFLTCYHVPHLQVTRRYSSSSAVTRLLTSFCQVSHSYVIIDVTCLRHLLTSSFDFRRFNRWLLAGLTIDFFPKLTFCSPSAPYPFFSRRFHFCSPFLHILLLNEE